MRSAVSWRGHGLDVLQADPPGTTRLFDFREQAPGDPSSFCRLDAAGDALAHAADLDAAGGFALRRRQFLGGVAGSIAAGPLFSRQASALSDAAFRVPELRPLSTLIQDGAVAVIDYIPAEYRASIKAGTCNVDLAPYINHAVRDVLRRPSGGILYFEAGSYPVSQIDATNDDPAQFYVALRIVGAGRLSTRITPAGKGAILLNASGRNAMTVEAIQFFSHEFESSIGILLARTDRSANAAGNQFRDVVINGNFAIAPVVSIAAETTSWQGCQFGNTNPAAGHRCFITADDPSATKLQPLVGYRLVSGPNTANSMIDCVFDCAYAGATPILFEGQAAYSMVQCAILGGEAPNTRLVQYRPKSGVFTGPVSWINSHFEAVGGGTIVHALDVPDGTSHIRGINNYSGNYVIGSNAELLSQTGSPHGQAVLMGSTWTVPHVPWGSTNLRFAVFGLTESRIDLSLGKAVGTVTIPGFIQGSDVRAPFLSIGRVIP